jgi:hypothetical protein
MGEQTRRDLLRSLSCLGAAGLAGCTFGLTPDQESTQQRDTPAIDGPTGIQTPIDDVTSGEAQKPFEKITVDGSAVRVVLNSREYTRVELHNKNGDVIRVDSDPTTVVRFTLGDDRRNNKTVVLYDESGRVATQPLRLKPVPKITRVGLVQNTDALSIENVTGFTERERQRQLYVIVRNVGTISDRLTHLWIEGVPNPTEPGELTKGRIYGQPQNGVELPPGEEVAVAPSTAPLTTAGGSAISCGSRMKIQVTINTEYTAADQTTAVRGEITSSGDGRLDSRTCDLSYSFTERVDPTT